MGKKNFAKSGLNTRAEGAESLFMPGQVHISTQQAAWIGENASGRAIKQRRCRSIEKTAHLKKVWREGLQKTVHSHTKTLVFGIGEKQSPKMRPTHPEQCSHVVQTAVRRHVLIHVTFTPAWWNAV